MIGQLAFDGGTHCERRATPRPELQLARATEELP